MLPGDAAAVNGSLFSFSFFVYWNKGGFSMGGAMALHLVCRYHPDVAGVFALSSFLNKDSVAFQVHQQSAISIKPMDGL